MTAEFISMSESHEEFLRTVRKNPINFIGNPVLRSTNHYSSFQTKIQLGRFYLQYSNHAFPDELLQFPQNGLYNLISNFNQIQSYFIQMFTQKMLQTININGCVMNLFDFYRIRCFTVQTFVNSKRHRSDDYQWAWFNCIYEIKFYTYYVNESTPDSDMFTFDRFYMQNYRKPLYFMPIMRIIESCFATILVTMTEFEERDNYVFSDKIHNLCESINRRSLLLKLMQTQISNSDEIPNNSQKNRIFPWKLLEEFQKFLDDLHDNYYQEGQDIDGNNDNAHADQNQDEILYRLFESAVESDIPAILTIHDDNQLMLQIRESDESDVSTTVFQIEFQLTKQMYLLKKMKFLLSSKYGYHIKTEISDKSIITYKNLYNIYSDTTKNTLKLLQYELNIIEEVEQNEDEEVADEIRVEINIEREVNYRPNIFRRIFQRIRSLFRRE